MTLIPALGKMRQEGGQKLQAVLGYAVRSHRINEQKTKPHIG